MTDPDAVLLERALSLATANVAHGGGPFGAVVAREGLVVASGVNQVVATLDPTAHAEVVAVRAACTALGTFALTGCTLYASCEPCPMCAAASMWARVDRVVFAADRHAAAAAGFDDAAFYTALAGPASSWPLPVEHRPHPQAHEPFDAWGAHADRSAY